MRTLSSTLVAFGLLSCVMQARSAERADQQCPISIDNAALSYSHAGGVSTPQLVVVLSNTTGKRVASATFQLSQLGEGGYAHPYPDDLTLERGVNAHKRARHVWNLDPEAIDMRRTGHSLLLLYVQFDDETSWKDDGSESCVLTVDYHAR